MTGLIGKVLWSILETLATKVFVSKILAIGAWRASQMSENKVDDKMAEAFADALGVPPELYK